ncbi:MAG: SUMF1/EgtB/PvdO family nonheme iron enzyme [Armatimonadetes bacterium]|nr:SUMF1/EgtB/PvdO family nonheme iron enzyme [Armatimonadota bacterium]
MKRIYLILIIAFLFLVGCEKNQVLQYQVSAGIQMRFVNTQAQREEWPDEFTANVFMSYSYWTMEEEEITVEIEKELLIQRFEDSLSVYYQAVENFEIPEITQEIWPRVDVTADINGVEWTGFADVQLFPGQTVSVEIELYPGLGADFEGFPTEGTAPLDVFFEDYSTGDIISWQWDFDNDGTIDSYDSSGQWRYSAAGSYSVSLTVSDGTNEDTEVKVDYITVTEDSNEMIFVQGGTFEMGDHYFEGDEDELPVHSVYLDSYYIGKYEVTQAEYEAVVGTNPSYFIGDDLPVEQVSWYDAVTFCNLKSQQEGLTPCYNLDDWSCNFSANGYRLPTEAEWEYAARGGVNWTDDYRHSGCHEIGELPYYAWYSDDQTHPVGTKLPNQLEVFDMSGNVWEWCNDWYGFDYYSSSPPSNPHGPDDEFGRILRGGGWGSSADGCRVAVRNSSYPGLSQYRYFGFRFARTPR